jgi:hypothetical protein
MYALFFCLQENFRFGCMGLMQASVEVIGAGGIFPPALFIWDAGHLGNFVGPMGQSGPLPIPSH